MTKRRNIPVKKTKRLREKMTSPINPVWCGSKKKTTPSHAISVINVKKRIPQR